jgi:hypothetical protein
LSDPKFIDSEGYLIDPLGKQRLRCPRKAMHLMNIVIPNEIIVNCALDAKGVFIESYKNRPLEIIDDTTDYLALVKDRFGKFGLNLSSNQDDFVLALNVSLHPFRVILSAVYLIKIDYL